MFASHVVCSQSEQPDKLSELRPEGRVRILKREGTYIKMGVGIRPPPFLVFVYSLSGPLREFIQLLRLAAFPVVSSFACKY